jgi:hypothetical protein
MNFCQLSVFDQYQQIHPILTKNISKPRENANKRRINSYSYILSFSYHRSHQTATSKVNSEVIDHLRLNPNLSAKIGEILI